jgi:hypothetical protein
VTTDEQEPRNSGTWDQGFEGHERAQLLRLAALSFREKLGWLEEAHRLVRRLRGGDERRQQGVAHRESGAHREP